MQEQEYEYEYNQGSLFVDVSTPISHTDDVWSCVGLDYWPKSKCDYGRCAWGLDSFLNIDLDSPHLQAAVKALAPVHLRLGGSLCDFVTYNISTGASQCVPFSEPTNSTVLGYDIGTGCLPMDRWDALNHFCEKTNDFNSF